VLKLSKTDFGHKIHQTEQTLKQKIEETKQEDSNEINQAQRIAAGAPLIILGDPKRVPPMHE